MKTAPTRGNLRESRRKEPPMDAHYWAIHELGKRIDYHDGDISRAVADLKEEDQDRVKLVAETVLAHPLIAGRP